MNEKLESPHRLTLNERKALTMTGVTEVLSFDENAIALRTDLGILQIHGSQLQLKDLSREKGSMMVEGTIAALVYEQPRQGGFWRRLMG